MENTNKIVDACIEIIDNNTSNPNVVLVPHALDAYQEHQLARYMRKKN